MTFTRKPGEPSHLSRPTRAPAPDTSHLVGPLRGEEPKLAPGLARAPRVKALLDDAYGLVQGELRILKEQAEHRQLDKEEFRRFVALLERMPAMLREERAGDKERAEMLAAMNPELVKALAAAYIGGPEVSENDDRGTDGVPSPEEAPSREAGGLPEGDAVP